MPSGRARGSVDRRGWPRRARRAASRLRASNPGTATSTTTSCGRPTPSSTARPAIRFPVRPRRSTRPRQRYFQDVFPLVRRRRRATRGLLPFPPLPALVLLPFVALLGLHRRPGVDRDRSARSASGLPGGCSAGSGSGWRSGRWRRSCSSPSGPSSGTRPQRRRAPGTSPTSWRSTRAARRRRRARRAIRGAGRRRRRDDGRRRGRARPTPPTAGGRRRAWPLDRSPVPRRAPARASPAPRACRHLRRAVLRARRAAAGRARRRGSSAGLGGVIPVGGAARLQRRSPPATSSTRATTTSTGSRRRLPDARLPPGLGGRGPRATCPRTSGSCSARCPVSLPDVMPDTPRLRPDRGPVHGARAPTRGLFDPDCPLAVPRRHRDEPPADRARPAARPVRASGGYRSQPAGVGAGARRARDRRCSTSPTSARAGSSGATASRSTSSRSLLPLVALGAGRAATAGRG